MAYGDAETDGSTIVEHVHRETVSPERLSYYSLAVPMEGMNARRLYDEYVSDNNLDIKAQIEIHPSLHAYKIIFSKYPTLCINIPGSFLIGLFSAWAVRSLLSGDLRLLLVVGLCG